VILPSLPDGQSPSGFVVVVVDTGGERELEVGTGSRFSAGLALGLASDLLDSVAPACSEIRTQILYSKQSKSPESLPFRALALEAPRDSNVPGAANDARGEVRAQGSQYDGVSTGYHSGLWEPRESSAHTSSPTRPGEGFLDRCSSRLLIARAAVE